MKNKHMKNLIIGLVVLALLGGGYFYFKTSGMLSKAPAGTTTTGNGNVFTSIKDALSKSLSLKCVYKDEQGIETTTYIKGGAVRVMMTNSQSSEDPNNVG